MPFHIRHARRLGYGWPTTLRFSRRLGEATRDVDYASAIEGPAGPVILPPNGTAPRPLSRLLLDLAIMLVTAITGGPGRVAADRPG
ncbi:MAG: hypothetical protein JWQ76_2419 [Ramlibacter sp.]|nr:hypothetical protein [Ramlibacter sp.]